MTVQQNKLLIKLEETIQDYFQNNPFALGWFDTEEINRILNEHEVLVKDLMKQCGYSLSEAYTQMTLLTNELKLKPLGFELKKEESKAWTSNDELKENYAKLDKEKKESEES